jgi:hypothetical protein
MHLHAPTHPLYNPRIKLQDTLTHSLSYSLWQLIQAVSSLSHYVKENHSSDLGSSLQDPKKMGMAHSCDPFPAIPLNTPVILYCFYAQDKNN